ncbi:hypothetical protein Tco_0992205 [Tanacetum coccineum]|uniref:Uncharacterized protein n=1 Tax=Tanacetum coccineum TaxID=301880 RepID=A0ABQ5F1H0_9ASTR
MESLNSNSQERELHQLQQRQDKAKESCMISSRLLHSHLKALSNNDLKGTRIEGCFERAFVALFDQNVRQFRDILIQHIESVKKSIEERALHTREYVNGVNERKMQSKEGKDDSRETLDAHLVVTKSNET